MTYYEDVKFLTDAVPDLVRRNASEFQRLHNLLEPLKSTIKDAAQNTVWDGAGRKQYDARLGDASNLISTLSHAFDLAAKALDDYVPRLDSAQKMVTAGQVTEKKLGDLVQKVAIAVTRTSQEAEPMRRWEDISTTSGFFDWIAELGMDVDSIRSDAQRYYDQTNATFTAAKSAEAAARKDCLDALQAAYDAVPNFRADSKEAAAIIAGIHDIDKVAAQHSGDPNVRLQGIGPKADVDAADPNAPVSDKLRQLQEIADTLPAGVNNQYWLTDNSDKNRSDFISKNKDIITRAAQEAGLPPDLVAGIAWQEVGGKGRVFDDLAGDVRHLAESPLSPLAPDHLPGRLAGEPDETSYGPLSIQTRRAAEVLGYNPETLSDDQRAQVEHAIKDPKMNILISAQYAGNLKAESGFADVPPGQMTPNQYAEIGARYNGGPNYQDPDAQSYGRSLNKDLPQARKALE